ncbi:MAG: MBL fold metallo-hydrolase [Chloroflexi bacterium]|nr:MBL fold metallo-hydrolase [Chloroflexota bacterium]
MIKIQELAPEFFRISLVGADFFNVYLLEDVLVDSGPRFTSKKLLSMLKGHPLKAHALTHGHFDHQGGSRLVCASFDIPLWCSEGDREAVESGNMNSISPLSSQDLAWLDRWLAGPPQPVSRILHQDDLVGGFRVMEVPGHTPGSLAFWREQDRVLLIGDVLFHRNPVTLRSGLSEPFPWVTYNVARNRASAKTLAALQPSLVCFGHGKELRDTRLFGEFIAGLPAA